MYIEYKVEIKIVNSNGNSSKAKNEVFIGLKAWTLVFSGGIKIWWGSLQRGYFSW